MSAQVWVSTHMSISYSTHGKPAFVYLQFHDDGGEIFAVQQIPAEQIEELIDTIRRAAAGRRILLLGRYIPPGGAFGVCSYHRVGSGRLCGRRGSPGHAAQVRGSAIAVGRGYARDGRSVELKRSVLRPIVRPVAGEVGPHKPHDARGRLSGRCRVLIHFIAPDGLRVCIEQAGKLGAGEAQLAPGLAEFMRGH